MKSRAVRTALTCLVALFALEGGVRALEPALPEVNTWREPLVNAKVGRMNALRRQGSMDVVFAGSSQMLFAGDVARLRRDLGVRWSAYNAALWGAPPVVSEHWLLNVVAPRLQPRSVILGVSPIDFVEAATDVDVRNYFNAAAVRDDWLGGVERALARRSALFRHRRDLRGPKLIMDGLQRRVRGESGPEIPGAGLDPFGRMPGKDDLVFRDDPAARELIAGVVANGMKLSRPQVEAFERTVRGLRARATEVLVVDMAISQPMIDLLGGASAYADFRSFLRREADTLGVQLLDPASGVSDTTFFIDYDHVNRAGTEVFMTVLARLLGAGTPGALHAGIDPSVARKPLAPVLASHLLEARPVNPAASTPQVPVGTPAVPVPKPSVAPDLRAPVFPLPAPVP